MFGGLGILIVLCLTAIFATNDRDRAEHDARFLRQCAEAGYDAAKCRFFLTNGQHEHCGNTTLPREVVATESPPDRPPSSPMTGVAQALGRVIGAALGKRVERQAF